MALLTSSERTFLGAVSELGFSNPFSAAWSGWEKAALGDQFVSGEPVWSLRVEDPARPRENVTRLLGRMKPLVEKVREKLAAGERGSRADLVLYEDAAVQLLFHTYYASFCSAAAGGGWRFWERFRADWRRLLEVDGVALPSGHDPAHHFACFRQVQRAFDRILAAIVGRSGAAARLRASVWESIFTHDIRRYRRTFYSRMGEFATLITGPSGTGKEIVARAIAGSRYVAFDERRMMFAEESEAFFPINISALSPTLVESELFGHRRGAFTGAVADRKGWLEACPPSGTVFLDELGDLDPAIQVKLLRVIETRVFHPVGDSKGREFRGKLIAATNRDLGRAIREGAFREDLYYRLCSDQVHTPRLADQIANEPEVLRELVVYMTRRVAGAEAESLAGEVVAWVEAHLGREYAWPGNYRELEQCVKNVVIRKDYRPLEGTSGEEDWVERLRGCKMTAAELLSWYCTRVYRRVGTLEKAAERLDMDRRTVRSKVEL